MTSRVLNLHPARTSLDLGTGYQAMFFADDLAQFVNLKFN